MVHFGFWNFCFRNRFVSEMLGAAYGLIRELCVGFFLCGIDKIWTFWTKTKLF